MKIVKTRERWGVHDYYMLRGEKGALRASKEEHGKIQTDQQKLDSTRLDSQHPLKSVISMSCPSAPMINKYMRENNERNHEKKQ